MISIKKKKAIQRTTVTEEGKPIQPVKNYDGQNENMADN